MKKNIHKATKDYIREHPSIKDCLIKGIINYSALSRLISKDLKIKKFDAVLIACRRYREKIKNKKTLESRIKKILKKSRLEIKTKIIIVVIEKPRFFSELLSLEESIKKQKGMFNLIEGTETITIITDLEFKELIKEKLKLKIIKINKNFVQINIICPPEIESTPGVISHIYSLFAENGINILEEMSCWTDIMIIIDEKDLSKVMEFLKF
ncbi:ACT domain-containing protein [Candidatus Woesearchaeota archaeon]|nr:ACT domain-containing protein [Candidatus Woesearchaeota archaeon]